MQLLCGGARVRWSLFLVWLVFCASCQADVSSPAASIDTQQTELGGPGGSGAGSSGCEAIDGADTTCDGVDDDCDGALDEDCDFGPSDCPEGSRVIAGHHDRDFLWGTSRVDCILGYGGDDVLWGLDGNDVLVGGAGNDVLVGWDGRDTLFGDRGDDVLLGDRGDDQLDGGEGNDLLLGGDGTDSVHGGACHDNIVALAGSDRLFGDDGSDRVTTSGRSHRVDGGGGIDACTGTSCELSGSAARVCFRDSDCGAGKRCVPGSLVCVPEGELAGVDATCDGYDDDCDGQLDEDFEAGTSECGVGACAATGTTVCLDGTATDSCTPGTPAPSDATCDAVDEDCNGAADEDYAPLATSCGVGACAAAGATVCMNGTVLDSCMPGTPAADDATCDGIDDDCDGVADENYAPVDTICGVGACAATGVTACSGGAVTDTCTPGQPIGDDSTCDTIDDDCDGTSDEAYAPITTFCEVGGCLAQGATACSAGVEEDQCLTVHICIAEIACGDEVDNDGDALVDCADVDCADEARCAPQPFSMTVQGRSNLWGAGHTSAPGGGGLPPGIGLTLRGGATMRFSSVTGTITNFEAGIWPAEGVVGAANLPDGAGLAGYRHFTRSHGLTGVFLSVNEPMDPAPARLTFADAEFTELRPGLNQIFYIGDGLTSAGEVQRFIVPQGATRLFLGHGHACSNGAVGCFVGLGGTYNAVGEIKFDY